MAQVSGLARLASRGQAASLRCICRGFGECTPVYHSGRLFAERFEPQQDPSGVRYPLREPSGKASFTRHEPEAKPARRWGPGQDLAGAGLPGGRRRDDDQSLLALPPEP